MSRTITISDEMYDALIKLSVAQTAPERSSDEFFNAQEFWGQYDDAYDGGVDDGYIELAREIVESMRMEDERK
jgi:hypothetical protein